MLCGMVNVTRGVRTTHSSSSMALPTGWQLDGADGPPILGSTDKHVEHPRGVLILCHGFKGYMDYGLFPRLAAVAAGQGLLVHRFNFSHSGMTRETDTFERPDLFERDTWGKQIQDLRAVAEAVATGQLDGQGLPMVWFGHSRGGVTVTLTASRAFADPQAEHVRPAGIAIASTPDVACSLSEQDREKMRRDGRLLSPSGRTGQRLFVGKPWLDEIEADPEAFDPKLAAERVPCPTLIVHGGEDQTVNASAAIALSQRFPASEIEVIGGASHTYNCPNPLPHDAEPPEATARMMDRVTGFAVGGCDAQASV